MRDESRDVRRSWDIKRDEGPEDIVVRKTTPSDKWLNGGSNIYVAYDLPELMTVHGYLPLFVCRRGHCRKVSDVRRSRG
ncbi:MAG TPA: hypothetical protein VG095_03325 [Chthoniobacterales bacterium]|nr:hypothetical protein [Chthoniobacterales bacterium]